ncbi:hypothetical protein GQR58_023932 [Nymphon striatum]|nr:hypothetical protein GQR58_023932 [Nymphon striatum]
MKFHTFAYNFNSSYLENQVVLCHFLCLKLKLREENIAVIPDNWLQGSSVALWPDHLKGPGKLNKAVAYKFPPELLYHSMKFEKNCKRLSWLPLKQTPTLTRTLGNPKGSESKQIIILLPVNYLLIFVIFSGFSLNNYFYDYLLDVYPLLRIILAITFSDDDDCVHAEKHYKMSTGFKSIRKAHTKNVLTPERSSTPLSSDEEIAMSKFPAKPAARPPPQGSLGQRDPHTPIQMRERISVTPRPANQPSPIARDSRLFTCLEKILEKQKEIKEILGRLVAQQGTGQSTKDLDETILLSEISLPIKSLDQMTEVEAVLEDMSILFKLRIRLRVAEHAGKSFRSNNPLSNPPHSSILQHTNSCKCQITLSNFAIIGSAKSDIELRILESIHIYKKRPSLNDTLSSYPLES